MCDKQKPSKKKKKMMKLYLLATDSKTRVQNHCTKYKKKKLRYSRYVCPGVFYFALDIEKFKNKTEKVNGKRKKKGTKKLML